jgi:hypothetical protein
LSILERDADVVLQLIVIPFVSRPHSANNVGYSTIFKADIDQADRLIIQAILIDFWRRCKCHSYWVGTSSMHNARAATFGGAGHNILCA